MTLIEQLKNFANMDDQQQIEAYGVLMGDMSKIQANEAQAIFDLLLLLTVGAKAVLDNNNPQNFMLMFMIDLAARRDDAVNYVLSDL